MSLFDSFINKIAADYDLEKELELIDRVKANPNDALAWKQLKLKFSGIIQSSIRNAGIYAPAIAPETLNAAAMKEFERSILNYDTNQKTKPSSYLMNNITLNLRKLNYEHMHDTRMSPDLSQKSQLVHNAKDLLKRELDREPTNEEIHDTIQTFFGKKNITLSQINLINDYTRDEFSANLTLGEEDKGEAITYGDVMNTGTTSPADFMNRQDRQEDLEKALNKLAPNERKIYMQYEQLGEYKGKSKPSLATVAFDNNLNSAWEAQKMIKSIRDKLRKELNKS